MDFEESPRKSLQNFIGAGYDKRGSTKSASWLDEQEENWPCRVPPEVPDQGVLRKLPGSSTPGYFHFLAHFWQYNCQKMTRSMCFLASQDLHRYIVKTFWQ
jgi:hypothetical protein